MASPRAPSGNYDRPGAMAMHLDTPAMNLRGFSHMTAVMAFCANQATHVGGGHLIK